MELFTAAGIAISSFTFSAAAVHTAVRLNGHRDGEGFVGLGRTPEGAVEVYGESPWRPVFSAEFEMAPERAAALALANCGCRRKPSRRRLEELLPRPTVNPVENDLSRNALPYAHGAGRGLSPAGAGGERFAARVPALALARHVRSHSGARRAGAGGADRHDRVAEVRRSPVSEDAGGPNRARPTRRRARRALDRETERTRARTALLDHTADARAPIWTRSASSPAW